MTTVTRFVKVISFHDYRDYAVPDGMKDEFEWLAEECFLNQWNLRYVKTTELKPADGASDPIYLSVQGVIYSGRQPRARFLIDSDAAGHLAVHITMHRLRGWSCFDNMYCVCDLVTGVCGFSLYELFLARTLDEADAGFGDKISDDEQFRGCTARLACAMATHPRLGARSLFSLIDPDLLRWIVQRVRYEVEWPSDADESVCS